VETLKKWLTNQDGSMKWEWMNHFPKLSLLEQLTKLTPLASAGIGAVYSHRFVNDVNQKAQEVFSHARQYLQQHQDLGLSPYAAYEKAVDLLQQATPKLMENLDHSAADKDKPILDKEIPIEGNQTIKQVKLVKKDQESLSPEEAEVKKDEKVSEGLDELTDKLVEHADAKQEQKPAIPKDSFDADAALEEELGLQENDTEMLQAAAEEETDTNNPENSETADKQTQAEETTEDVTKNAATKSKK